MAASIEAIGVSVTGKVTRRYDDAKDLTTIVMGEEQAQEMYDALGPVLEFFSQQNPK
jgi:hypothetical protein